MQKLASFRVKLVNFLSEKGRSSFFYDRYTSAVIGYVKELRQKDPKFSSSNSSIKDRLRSSVAFLIKEEGSALSFHQKFSPNYFKRVFFIYN